MKGRRRRSRRVGRLQTISGFGETTHLIKNKVICLNKIIYCFIKIIDCLIKIIDSLIKIIYCFIKIMDCFIKIIDLNQLDLKKYNLCIKFAPKPYLDYCLATWQSHPTNCVACPSENCGCETCLLNRKRQVTATRQSCC